MRSEAKTVEAYLAELPDDRRQAITEVRKTILDNLPEGVVERMAWGMIAYEVPLETYPDTYNKQPLAYAALASQKNHMAVYMSAIYGDDGARERFEDSYKSTGKRFDVGKSCVRFKKLEDLPLEVIGDAIGSLDVPGFIEQYESARARAAEAKAAKRPKKS